MPRIIDIIYADVMRERIVMDCGHHAVAAGDFVVGGEVPCERCEKCSGMPAGFAFDIGDLVVYRELADDTAIEVAVAGRALPASKSTLGIVVEKITRQSAGYILRSYTVEHEFDKSVEKQESELEKWQL